MFRFVRRSLLLASLTVLPLGAFVGTPTALALGKGQPDPSFGTGGFAVVSNARLFATAVQPDGKVVVVGDDEATTQHLLAVRFNANGTVDPSFNGGNPALGPANTVGRAVVVQPDGKIVVAGVATGSTALDPTEGSGMVVERFNANGTPDGGFGAGGVSVAAAAGGLGNAAGIQSDGKIVVGGSDTGAGGFPQTAFARFNTNGSLDGSFGSAGVASIDLGRYSVADGIAIQSDGRIVFGGSQRSDLRSTVFLAGRLNSNGSLDGSFGSGGAFQQQYANGAASSEARGVALQPDDKVVLGGDAADGSLGAVGLVVRLSSSGHPDGSFGSGGVARLPAVDNPNQCCGEERQPGAYAAAVSGGEIVVGGVYDSAGRARFVVWGIDSGGGLDGGFGSGGRLLGPLSGQSEEALGLSVAPDGNFVVAGAASAPFSSPFGLVGRIGGPPVTPAALKVTPNAKGSYRRGDVLKHGIKVGVTCSLACSLQVTVNLPKAVARKLHIDRTIGVFKATLGNGGAKTFTINNSKLKRAARAFSTLDLSLQITATSLTTHKVLVINRGVTIRK